MYKLVQVKEKRTQVSMIHGEECHKVFTSWRLYDKDGQFIRAFEQNWTRLPLSTVSMLCKVWDVTEQKVKDVIASDREVEVPACLKAVQGVVWYPYHYDGRPLIRNGADLSRLHDAKNVAKTLPVDDLRTSVKDRILMGDESEDLMRDCYELVKKDMNI